MECTALPLTFSNSIDVVGQKFWWDHLNKNKGLNLKARDDLYLLKTVGGFDLMKSYGDDNFYMDTLLFVATS